MPRGGRSGGSSFGSRAAPPPRSTATPAAPPRAAPPPVQATQSSGPGLMGMMGQSMAMGVGMGAGSEIGHQAVRSLMGGSGGGQHQQQQQAPQQMQKPDPCALYNSQFMECLQKNQEEISFCQRYVDLFKQCKADNPM